MKPFPQNCCKFLQELTEELKIAPPETASDIIYRVGYLFIFAGYGDATYEALFYLRSGTLQMNPSSALNSYQYLVLTLCNALAIASPDYENLSVKKKLRQKIIRAVRKSYMSDITDEQWELLKGFIPAAKTGGRPRKVEVREIINAIFYILSAGCPWRLLPHDFPVWQRRALVVGSPDVNSATRQTVSEYFRNWRIEKIWEPINRQFSQRMQSR